MTKGYPIFEWSPGIPITEKDNKTQSGEDETIQQMKTSTMMKSLKMEVEVPKKRHMNMSTHQKGIMIQVRTSSKIKTKMTKETPPLKMMAQKND